MQRPIAVLSVALVISFGGVCCAARRHRCAHGEVDAQVGRDAVISDQQYAFERGAGFPYSPGSSKQAELSLPADTLLGTRRRVPPPRHLRRRQFNAAENMTWQPIRIVVDTSLLTADLSADANGRKYACASTSDKVFVEHQGATGITSCASACGGSCVWDPAQRTAFLQTFLPQAKRTMEQLLSVERVSGPLVVKSARYPKWTGIPGRNANGVRSINNADMLLARTLGRQSTPGGAKSTRTHSYCI